VETLPLLLSVPITKATTEIDTIEMTETTPTDLGTTLLDLETVVEITEVLSTATAEATMETTTIRRDNVILTVTAVSTQDQATSLQDQDLDLVSTLGSTPASTPVSTTEETRIP